MSATVSRQWPVLLSSFVVLFIDGAKDHLKTKQHFEQMLVIITAAGYTKELIQPVYKIFNFVISNNHRLPLTLTTNHGSLLFSIINFYPYYYGPQQSLIIIVS